MENVATVLSIDKMGERYNDGALNQLNCLSNDFSFVNIKVKLHFH